jgi:hypothetical protein
MNSHALLLRLNPTIWPNWESSLKEKGKDIWFITGRRKADRLNQGIPTVVLGTHGLGIVAYGTTTSAVEFREDPDWIEVSPELQHGYKQKENRISVQLQRVTVPLKPITRIESISTLHKTARETITWLSEEQYTNLLTLINEYNKS